MPVSIHPAAEVDYPHDPLADGVELAVGNVRIRAIHTPGHRPEHCCLAVIDTTRADEPWLVLTGDSLFVGDAARPDLAVEARRGRGGPLPLAPAAARAARRRRGVPGARRRLALRQGDELAELDDDRVRAALQPDGDDRRARRLRRGVGERLLSEATEPRADRGAQPRPVSGSRSGGGRAPRAARRLPAPRRPPASTTTSPVTGRARSTSPWAGRASRRRRASRSTPTSASPCSRPTTHEAARAIAGLRSVAFREIAGLCARRRARAEPVRRGSTSSTSSSPREPTVIDVREKDERDEGYIPGSRNVPYRLMRHCCPGPARTTARS